MSNINVNEAGEALVRASGQVILKGLDSFFSDPENRRRFEEWKKRRWEAVSDSRAGGTRS